MSNAEAPSPSFPPSYLAEDNGTAPYCLAITFIILEVICIALRFWAQAIGNRAWGADDTIIIPAAILCLAVCGCALADLIAGGVGHHQAALAMTDPGKIVVWAKFVLIIPELYLAAATLPKLAILALYLRIFVTAPYRIACWTLAAILTANWIGTTVAGFLTCIPLRFLWDHTVPGGHCFNINAYFRWSSLTNVITDVIMLILPLPVIWKIQTSRNVKIGLSVTFATGSIGLVTSIIRFAGFFAQNAEVDGTYSAAELIVWTICESGIYLIAACLPTYRPLASLFRKRGPLLSLHSGSKTVKPGQSRPKNGTLDIPLETRQNAGFTRLGDNRSKLVRPFTNSEQTISYAERGETPTGEARGPTAILVRHDVDVLSTQTSVRR